MSWTKYTITKTDLIFKAADTSVSKTLLTLAAGEKLTGLVIKASEKFAGTDITNITVSVGSPTHPRFYAPEWDILQLVGRSYSCGGAFADTDLNISLTFTADSDFGNGSTTLLTTGAIDVWVRKEVTAATVTVDGDSRFSEQNNFNAIPATGLLAAYDMVNIVGSTLKDISGNGNDGTLHGPTVTSEGLTFDGVNDYVSIPALIGNSDFTVLAIAKAELDSVYFLWSETNSSDLDNLIGLSVYPSQAVIRDGDNNGGALGKIRQPWGRNFHGIYLRRSGRFGSLGVIDDEVHVTTDLGVSVNITTDKAALGARDKSSSRDLFWEGSIAYLLIYDRALNETDLQFAFEQARRTVEQRGVYVAAVLSPLPPGPVWERQGVVIDMTLAAEEPYGCQEATVIYDTNPQIVAGAGCFKAWYTGGGGSVFYAESLTAMPGTWEKLTSPSPVLPDLNGSTVIKVDDDSYYLYAKNASTGNLDLYTSPDGINFTLLQADVITPGDPGDWDGVNIWNSFVFREAPDLWRMTFDGHSIADRYQTGTATSRDGINWVKNPNNPVSLRVENGWGGTSVVKAGGYYWASAHNESSFVQSDIIRARAKDFNGPWQLFPRGVAFETSGELNERKQRADRILVEHGGKTYMFYEGGETIGGVFRIKLAIANMPFSEVIKTSEGAIPLPTEARLILDAGTLALSDNDPVSLWEDQSGLANDATQATSGKRPVFKTNIINSLPVVRFDGVNDELGFPEIAVGGFAIFIVQKSSGDGMLLGHSTNNCDMRIGPEGSNVLYTYDGAYRKEARSSELTVPRNTFSLIEFVGEHGKITFYENGVEIGRGECDGFDLDRVGTLFGLAPFLTGDVAELRVYTAMDDTDRVAVETELMAKFDLPAAPASTLTLWLKADSLSLSDGDPVSTWVDSSGSLYNATQSGSARPIFKTAIVNGLPVVRFDGADDSLNFTALPLTDFSLFVVQKSTGDCALVANSSANYQFRIGRSGDILTSFDGTTLIDSSALSVSRSSFSLVELISSGGTFSFYENGVAKGSGSCAGLTFSAVGLLLGSGIPLNGDIAEIKLYSSGLDTTARQAVETELVTKYGL